jgi:hypothetical protein
MLWPKPTTVVHRHRKYVPTSSLGGTLPDTSSSISIRDVTGVEVAHPEKRTTVALERSKQRAKVRRK